jgi:hypothetical protein
VAVVVMCSRGEGDRSNGGDGGVGAWAGGGGGRAAQRMICGLRRLYIDSAAEAALQPIWSVWYQQWPCYCPLG